MNKKQIGLRLRQAPFELLNPTLKNYLGQQAEWLRALDRDSIYFVLHARVQVPCREDDINVFVNSLCEEITAVQLRINRRLDSLKSAYCELFWDEETKARVIENRRRSELKHKAKEKYERT